ncbi:phage tail protein [Nocardioides sp. BP30]|uniref:phage tail protein n=1 Tax=Nocardioides sp. BP30 TaxID=3036374 RepID=UPI0024685A65|nr:phage tail protein [Nocardioides sp. BP30]WGL52101.1 phage tail protein [Nocardioides sp. BP30]
MPNDLISTDPIVAQNFYLELDGVSIVLSSVGGLDLEFDVVTMSQAGPGGIKQQVKTRGSVLKVSDLTITRMAPKDAMNDPIWKWFYTIHDKGFVIGDRTNNRKNGSVVLYDSSQAEIGRYNFFNGWPSKISTDQMSSDSNEPVKENITLVIERLQRVK